MTIPTSPPFYFALAMIGLDADKPAATTVPVMTLYWATDTPAFYVSDGTSWNVPPGGGGGSITEIESTDSSIDVTNGTGPTTDLAVADSPAVGGVAITGTPTAGQIPTATDGTDATWQDPTGGGLPTGWTEDASDPANVSTNGGNLDLATGHVGTDDGAGTTSQFQAGTIATSSGAEAYALEIGAGFVSIAPAGVPAYNAFDSAGGTVALDGGGLTIENAPLGESIAIVTVQTGVPTTYQTPLVFDDTLVSGGLYAWDGSAYQKVGGPL